MGLGYLMKSPEGNVLLTSLQIATLVKEVAQQLNKDYKRRSPLLVGVLNGSFIFMSDLVRQLSFVAEICFVQLSSYGNDTKTSGEVHLVRDIDIDVRGRSVLIIEDIVDTGLTIKWLCSYLREKGAHPVKVCTLLSRNPKDITPDYVGMQLKTDKFLVGYGLDLDNKFRNFPYIIEFGG